jgi:hypothetical protein
MRADGRQARRLDAADDAARLAAGAAQDQGGDR